ncbi:MAG: IS982 family transposase [Flavobacteriaceae bacterium]|nr:IS982 family transposase [Flavobacteriaceae bacterium]
MHNFEAKYNKILETLQLNIDKSNFIIQKRKPKLSDIELIAIDLTAEYMSIDSEHQLFRDLQSTRFFGLIERTVYNRRKRGLVNHIEEIRVILSEKFNEFEDYFVVDSMPLEACKLSRSLRSKICKEDFYSAPDRGFCASQQMHFYGYKLHAVCSVQGVFKSLDISKASIHDIHYLKDIKHQLSDCVLLGDKGYLSKVQQLDLFETAKIRLETPMRINQKNYKKQPYIFRKSRKRIETLFSQLCDQFMIRRNYAKSFLGFKTRIISKITALTIIQYINKFTFDRNINNLKINIA